MKKGLKNSYRIVGLHNFGIPGPNVGITTNEEEDVVVAVVSFPFRCFCSFLPRKSESFHGFGHLTPWHKVKKSSSSSLALGFGFGLLLQENLERMKVEEEFVVVAVVVDDDFGSGRAAMEVDFLLS